MGFLGSDGVWIEKWGGVEIMVFIVVGKWW